MDPSQEFLGKVDDSRYKHVPPKLRGSPQENYVKKMQLVLGYACTIKGLVNFFL